MTKYQPDCYAAFEAIDLIDFLEDEIFELIGTDGNITLTRLKFEIKKLLPWAGDNTYLLETALDMIESYGY